MERLRKLKPSFHSLGSLFSRRIAPNAAAASASLIGERFSKGKADRVPDAADSLIGERFVKCKPHLHLIRSIQPNLAGSLHPVMFAQLFPQHLVHRNPFSPGSKRFFSGGNCEEKEKEKGKEKKEEEVPVGVQVLVCILGLVMFVLMVSGDQRFSKKEVPYSHKRFSSKDSDDDRKIGERLLKMKEEKEFKFAILPATHPLSVKVCFILRKLLDALHSDLGLDQSPRITYHGLEDATVVEPNQKGITAFSFKKNSEERRDKSQLRGMNWQVVVVDKNEKEAYTLGGGIIVVSSGLLNRHSDVWIAAVLAHEVGHIVARHVTEFLWFVCYYEGISTEVNTARLVDRYQRVEKEASYIGSQLMASAGYDPHEYENLEINYSKCEENGPISLEERCTTHVKEEALAVYRRIRPATYG